MYVERRPINDLPKGAKILTEDEVLVFYDNHIFGTTHTKDIWYLKYGFTAAGVSAFVTNYLLVDYYRRRCKISGLGPLLLMNSCFVAVPSALALTFHYAECRRRILLENLCMNCLYGRAAVYQTLFGILYGMGPSALGCLLYAGMIDSYPVPGIGSRKDFKGTLEVWKKFSKRKIPAFCLLFVANTAAIIFITKKEFENKDRLDEILREQHEKLKAVAAQYQGKK